MIRSSQATRSKAHRLLAAVAVLIAGGTAQQLSARGFHAVPPATRFHSRITAGLRSSAATSGSAGVLRAALPGPAPLGMALLRIQTVDAIENDSARMTVAWTLTLYAAGFGDPSASLTGIGTYRPGPGWRGGLDGFGQAAVFVTKGSLDCLFAQRSFFMRGLKVRANVPSSSTLFSLATLNRMLRGDLYLPFKPSVGGLRFNYDDSVRPGPKTSGHSGGCASAMFTSAVMRNGITISAGMLFGIRTTAFSRAGALRSMVPVAEKNAVPALGMRLSF